MLFVQSAMMTDPQNVAWCQGCTCRILPPAGPSAVRVQWACHFRLRQWRMHEAVKLQSCSVDWLPGGVKLVKHSRQSSYKQEHPLNFAASFAWDWPGRAGWSLDTACCGRIASPGNRKVSLHCRWPWPTAQSSVSRDSKSVLPPNKAPGLEPWIPQVWRSIFTY